MQGFEERVLFSGLLLYFVPDFNNIFCDTGGSVLLNEKIE
jgi:hypothetical protein